MTRRSLSCEEFLRVEPPSEDAILEGAELERAFWTLRGRELEQRRKEAFWQATSQALDVAFLELETTRARLVALNSDLEARVASQVEEIVRHSRAVEQLNAELRAKVQDRSRQLAEALRRLSTDRLRDSELHPGDVFAEVVRIVRLLGRGGMGTVYLATDLSTGEDVALKLLGRNARSHHALGRFIHEARAACAAAHPAITRTRRVDVTDDGELFQILDYVPGITLEARLICGPLAPGSVARLGGVVSDALSAAHDAGVVHRDVKPSNLALSELSPGVRVFDFGIARTRDDDAAVAPGLVARSLLGTPRYMSPEQIHDSSRAGAKSDVYALGAVLFEMLTGKPPFSHDDVNAICLGHLHTPVPDPRQLRPETPLPLAALVRDCLAKREADRPDAITLSRSLHRLADSAGVASSSEVARIELQHFEAARLAATAEYEGR